MANVHPFDPPCTAPTAPNTAVSQRKTTPLSHRLLMNNCLMFVISLAFAAGLTFLVVHALNHYAYCTISPLHPVLDSITVSNFSLSSRPKQVSADWNVRMSLESWIGRGYLNLHGISISIFYVELLQVGFTSLVPFNMTPHNSTVYFGSKFTGSSGLCDDPMMKAMNANIAAGTVPLHVQFKASVRKSFKGRWVDHVDLVVDCKNVELAFGSSDKSRAHMSNPSQKCQVL